MVDPLFGTRLYRAMRDAYVPASTPVVTQSEAAVVVQISSAAKERMSEERVARENGTQDFEPEVPLYFNPRAKAQQR
jgi:hypothetical protein